MNNQSGLLLPYFQCRIILLCLVLAGGFAGCRKSEKASHDVQLKAWIDSLDRSSRIIGSPRAIASLDSFMATLGNRDIHDSILYFKFMKVLSHRDSTMDAAALAYTDSLLGLFGPGHVRRENPIDYSKALLLKGDDLLKQKEYYQAYRNYYKGKSFLTSMGEICECARYSSRIANMSFKEENYYQAIEYWKHELEELAHCREPENFQLEFIEKQGSMRNIGMAYMLINEPGKALDYFIQADQFINRNASRFPKEQNFIRFARIVILRNQAEAYALKGDNRTAERLIKKCLEHDPNIEWSIDVERESRQILAQIYIDSHAYDKAQAQLDSLRLLPGTTGNATANSLYQTLQAAILYGTGDFKGAGRLFMANLEAERNSKQKRNAESKNNVGHMLQQVQREHEMELAAEKAAREGLYLKFSILFSLAMAVIVYLIWRNARKRAANLRAVTKLNEVITKSNVALQDTVNALEESEVEKEKMLRIVAHDLRNPIAAMVSGADVLFWDQSPSEEQAMLVNAIQQSGQLAFGLIGQILQAGPDKKKISKSEEDLSEIVQSCIDMLSYKGKEKRQTIHYDYEKAIVPVDREKIWRVFSNLLSNAVKFSPRESAINVNLKKRSNLTLLSVQDHGIGIPDDLKGHIFLSSNDARRIGTAGEQSFGIGLSICKQIVEAHGGKIWFESVTGTGTTFFVELPD
ncbi:Signal transduction histidine kinase [Dyadobacter sp. SG02]|uniref:sensor histidine kinase n=1 Tax=Dyadobacter sp. SG02 TaxID=1855291 RepID=UPI0008BB56E4|nr:HAMP domain-containing sensor histidine kinase [Dyadobacter sp. SG02]SEI54985.1 Signal transduction histidine kinase [Dyadobacter sp. SG02]